MIGLNPSKKNGNRQNASGVFQLTPNAHDVIINGVVQHLAFIIFCLPNGFITSAFDRRRILITWFI
jgi:hypothetical protein